MAQVEVAIFVQYWEDTPDKLQELEHGSVSGDGQHGALGVKDDGKIFIQVSDVPDVFCLGSMIAVRQVDSGGIHSRPTEEPEHVGLAASRTDCGNNLGMLVHFLINSHACYSPLQRVGKASLRQSIRY
jgi:hypothetical protein